VRRVSGYSCCMRNLSAGSLPDDELRGRSQLYVISGTSRFTVLRSAYLVELNLERACIAEQAR
jgi:hypothetical protein